VRVLVDRLNRGTGYLPWSDVTVSDGVVRTSTTPAPLHPIA
jgi:hypothetical protein